jgi:two-component system nitrate/nitrite response regulator NarL
MRVDLRQSLKALRAGARGFLHAGMGPEQIVQAVRRASEGKTVISEEMLEKLIAQEESTAEDLTVLTPRQREILGLVVEGLSNAQIAGRLFLTESTVKQHLRVAYKLLKVRNRIQAAKLLQGA